MTQKPLIIANWKMNPIGKKETERLFGALKKELRKIKNTEVVICPPFVWLNEVWKLGFQTFGNSASKSVGLKLGGQNCFWENEGAFTGEISPLMLKNLGCQYVIIGHSERRKYFQEDDELINKKLKAAFKNRLRPILCVGEEARDVFTAGGKIINEMSLAVSEQVKNGLTDISSARISELVIAYEPVWAIGTGASCSPDDAMKAALLIKKTLTNLYNRSVAERVRILYGGSVNDQNAVRYIKDAGMDGLLVGGASLNVSEFTKIVRNIEESYEEL